MLPSQSSFPRHSETRDAGSGLVLRLVIAIAITNSEIEPRPGAGRATSAEGRRRAEGTHVARACMWDDARMDDAVARYCAASASNDIDALLETLAPDAEVISPISAGFAFRGHDDVRMLLGAVYGSLRDLRWQSEIGDGDARVVVGSARVGPVGLDDAMVFELAPDGRIQRVRPHLRPWLGLTAFALVLAPKVARHPGALLRAMRKRPGT